MKTFIYFSQGEWRTFQAEELPVKPESGTPSMIRGYEAKIAALKAKSVKVGNPKMFTNTQGYWLDVNVGNGKPKEDEFYRWLGTVSRKKKAVVTSGGASTYEITAILKLPTP